MRSDDAYTEEAIVLFPSVEGTSSALDTQGPAATISCDDSAVCIGDVRLP